MCDTENYRICVFFSSSGDAGEYNAATCIVCYYAFIQRGVSFNALLLSSRRIEPHSDLLICHFRVREPARALKVYGKQHLCEVWAERL